jgi:dTDP-4-dehydrorhamnose 3,5-epimerase
MPFHCKNFEIEGVKLLTSKSFQDERGYFGELYKDSVFKEFGISDKFVQVNRSFSHQGVLRGMHYQAPPKCQAKLVTVLQGSIFDVAIDLRKQSSTYGKWIGVDLTSQAGEMLYVPEGFAHGFYVYSDDTIVVYFCNNEYSPSHENGLKYNDSDLQINWPQEKVLVADKDVNYPDFSQFQSPF